MSTPVGSWKRPPWEAVEGQTEALPFVLREDGIPVALGGFTVTLYLQPADGGARITATVENGRLVIVDDGALENHGRIDYKPAASDLTEAGSPYTVRFELVGTTGKGFYPRSVIPPELKVGPIV